ncbi:hypothetical protein ZHAS_00019019 [Anopheles sinensis]|uniref:F-box domain-containing protein n=1 Tax=Anopheles sinensis TaxID=74873 RepID=A0A084WL82_ANOSI|nr:hypothetical protein ZHAS_00019019 [Anopheles sinensis]
MATVSDGEQPSASGMNFLDLPDCMIEEVLEYLSYDEIAKKRIICRKIDRICQSLLNRGYIKMIRSHNVNLKAIKSQLPRRESERRNHPLSKHSDILTCVETRISMLSMTYSKYIERELCCFIPGKVIDEVLNILRIVENTSRPLRAHEVLQELRDISSMAIEHFDENIAGGLKRLLTQQNPHHPVPVAVNPFPNICYYQNELPEVVPVEKFMVPYATVTQTVPAPPPPPPPAMAGPSTSGTMISLYCQSGCNSSRENSASIVRINLKARKMRYDINRIDHTMASFKADLRNIRVHMLRQNAEMKDLRRRLDESETKNRELMAKINQFSNDNPQAVALKTELAKDSIKRSIKFIKRAISETEPGRSGFAAGRGPVPDEESSCSAFASVPFSVGLASLLSSDEEEFLTPTTALEDGPMLSGWANTKSDGRRQHRTTLLEAENVLLAEVETPDMLSPFRPTMFVLEVFNNGTVEVRKDDANQPFLQFRDVNLIPINYMAFTKWDKDLIYFYDYLEYFATESLEHVGRTDGSKYFRFGIVGPNDGHIRYGEIRFPYGKDVIEIAIKGCLQFDEVPGYNETQTYFVVDKLRNVGRTHNSRYIRLGVVGKSDGHIRFGRSLFPYDETVIEIVLGGWWNSQSVFRRQTRRRDYTFDNVLLKEAKTPRLMSRSEPLVFQLEVFDNGRIQLTRDGERRPFLEYVDNRQTIPMDYIAFTKWEADMIYFYDCPLLNDAGNPIDDTVLLRCSLA